tara:strand:+ start:1305 stop:1829 length:525 start_codon:yes stop_codon:yes gene_type:complete
MIIEKEIRRPIERPLVFLKGKLQLQDPTYFINKINEGVELENNNSYKTSVLGKMTSWNFFCQDKEFLKLYGEINDYVSDFFTHKYVLADAWGNRHENFDRTVPHDHIPSIWSGAIYFNKNPQKLIFPEINEELEPDVGAFVVFSSFLNHYTKTIFHEKPKYGISFNTRHLPISE